MLLSKVGALILGLPGGLELLLTRSVVWSNFKLFLFCFVFY